MSANAVHRFVIEPAEANPGATAVIDAASGQHTSRAQMVAGTKAAAAALAERGVQPEQRVMMCAADTPAFLWWFWGAMWIGAVPVPVSTMVRQHDYAFLLSDSRAVGLVYSPPFAPEVLPAADGQPFLRWTIDDTDTGLLGDPSAAPEPFPATDDDVAFWLYTSGTTGQPKGAMHRHIDMSVCTGSYARAVLDMGPDDVVYSVPKLFFAYGLGNSGYFSSGTGAIAVLNPDRPEPAAVADHVRSHRPTLFFSVPTNYAQLLAADLPEDTFSSVRQGISGGEPLPPEIHRRFAERFGVEILDGIGTTELAHIAISNRRGASVPGTTGTPLDGYEVSLRDEHGNEVADSEPGALHVAGGSVMTGYWNRTERTRAALQGRFLATGDTYVRNPDGTYTYQGRSDDMLKVGGIWVSPIEVEGCILEMDDVILAAVVGDLDAEGLTKPHAFVVPTEGARRDTLAERVQAHVRERLAAYKYPRWVDVVEELPLTATGKVKRYLLRD